MVSLLALLAVLLLLILFYVSLLLTLFTDAPFVPTGRKSVRQVLAIANLKPGMKFYDLGSGDGRLVRAAAAHGAQATGIERALVLVGWSRLCSWIQRIPNAYFIHGDFNTVPFHDVDVVYTYLLPKAMDKILPKLQKDLRPGTRILSRAFLFHNIKPVAIHPMGKFWNGKIKPPVYEYKM